jgi:hypothetical protein
MRTRRAISVTCALALLLALGLAGPAQATSPTNVSGTWDWDNLTWVTEKMAGGNEIFSGTEATARTGWSGSFEGDSFDTFSGVFHRSGVLTATLLVYFDGSVLGRSGTMTMHVTCLGAPDGGFGGSWVIKDGAGGLEGLHGQGRWGAWGGELVEYMGSVQWR